MNPNSESTSNIFMLDDKNKDEGSGSLKDVLKQYDASIEQKPSNEENEDIVIPTDNKQIDVEENIANVDARDDKNKDDGSASLRNALKQYDALIDQRPSNENNEEIFIPTDNDQIDVEENIADARDDVNAGSETDANIESIADVKLADDLDDAVVNDKNDYSNSKDSTDANADIKSEVVAGDDKDPASTTMVDNARSDADSSDEKEPRKRSRVEESEKDNLENIQVEDESQQRPSTENNLKSPDKHENISEEESSGSLESEINICISDTKLQDLRQKKSLKVKIQKLFGFHQSMTQREFDSQIQILYKCCLKSVRDLHELHLRRITGMEILDDLISRAKPTFLSIAHVIHITWSIMSCLHHFQLRLRTVSGGLVAWTRRRTAERCMASYSKLIRIFRPEMHRIILNAIITFYREGKLWQIEFACTELIVQLLEVYKYAEEGIEDMLYTIETSTLVNVHEAKYIVQVLYEILKKIRWKRMSEYLMKKFLSMLESSILPKSTDNYNYSPLRKGLEICLINTIGNLYTRDLIKLLYLILKKMNAKQIDEETLLCFGNVAVYAAKKYRIKSLRATILKGPLPLIFNLFKAKNSLLMLLATRIWQNLIDRNNNAIIFLTPKIFFQDCNYALNIKKCLEEDKAFFKSVRHLVYQISLNNFFNAQNRMGIENSFQAVALTLVEIPCGYTASCFITVAMTLQEYAFSITKDDLVRSHHLHATILSLLTLICYIHNAVVFYDYVNTVMERRAEWAPHLNPPLKTHYEYAQHHILWNKPELFFEDWEASYGLWKCFRVKKKPIQLERPE
ncbi:unnamed protein product [Phaedon cochleariae]|uniref:Uncharacterized protein n=1 Tax=Phaedon cochleariae TaxID=80249 RepID=A0A9P0GPI1_PHACE|nr:unnamed protein product [Phaedon cochleariae]